jgi:hypothetical protein
VEQWFADHLAKHPRVRMGKCKCGKGQHEHAGVGPAFGAGACEVEGSKCKRFTWVGELEGVELAAALEHAAEVDRRFIAGEYS